MAASQTAPRRRGMAETGYFASRRELTAHVWAMHRAQIIPNSAAIARACGIGVRTVGTIIEMGEGREDYLATGCPTGA